MLKHDLSLNMKKRLDKEIGVLHNNDRHVANRVSCDNPMYNLNSVNKGNYASCKLDQERIGYNSTNYNMYSVSNNYRNKNFYK